MVTFCFRFMFSLYVLRLRAGCPLFVAAANASRTVFASQDSVKKEESGRARRQDEYLLASRRFRLGRARDRASTRKSLWAPTRAPKLLPHARLRCLDAAVHEGSALCSRH
jgi:hypothetical protein